MNFSSFPDNENWLFSWVSLWESIDIWCDIILQVDLGLIYSSCFVMGSNWKFMWLTNVEVYATHGLRKSNRPWLWNLSNIIDMINWPIWPRSHCVGYIACQHLSSHTITFQAFLVMWMICLLLLHAILTTCNKFWSDLQLSCELIILWNCRPYVFQQSQRVTNTHNTINKINN